MPSFELDTSRQVQAFEGSSLSKPSPYASAAHLDEDPFSGTEREDKPQWKLNIDTVLVVSESFCITVAAAACVASMTMHGSQDSRFVGGVICSGAFRATESKPPYLAKLFLIAALIINAILRARQWQGRGYSRNSTSKLVVANSNVEERVQKLEEDTASVVTIIRVLSKQLEKLAVRFRVTRQTLRDPIQETALLAQRTSDSVNVLAARESDLEKSLEEIHHVLLGMQVLRTFEPLLHLVKRVFFGKCVSLPYSQSHLPKYRKGIPSYHPSNYWTELISLDEVGCWKIKLIDHRRMVFCLKNLQLSSPQSVKFEEWHRCHRLKYRVEVMVE